MAYLALYREYRPKDFEGVIGQEHIVTTLVNQIKSQRIGHAYLFTGTRGTGKTSLAKIFAKAINCANPVNGSPCGKCESCIALSDPSNVDVIEIDAASNNGVEQIRDLKEKVQYAPTSCKYKVYIIDEVHMLSGAAFNALLKTLEEPPKHAVFILATTEVHKIPATILSRCMRFDFKLISTEKIAEHISNIYDKIGKSYEKEAVFAIAKAGEGSVRDALSVADTALSYSEGTLTYKQVTEILGSTDFDYICSFVENIILGNTSKILSSINELCSLGKSIGVLTKDVTEMLRNLLVIKTCDKPNDILALPSDLLKKLTSIANSTNADRLLHVSELFSTLEGEIKYSVHPRIVFETYAIKAAKPQTDCNLDALMGRIKTLEDRVKDITEKGIRVIEKEVVFEEENQGEVDSVKTDIVESVKKLSAFSSEDIKGKILSGLRANSNEMLWNFMQDVMVEVNGNILILTTQTADDANLLTNDEFDNKAKIMNALLPISGFQIDVKVSVKQKTLNEIDDATEKIKKIFGEDIVIINK